MIMYLCASITSYKELEVRHVPDQRIQGLNSFSVHPWVLLAAMLRLEQAEAVRKKRFVSPFDKCHKLTERIGTGSFVIVVKIGWVRQKIVWLSLQFLERGRNGKPRFFRHRNWTKMVTSPRQVAGCCVELFRFLLESS